jgi:fibronectin-binding autotransporter adhesin
MTGGIYNAHGQTAVLAGTVDFSAAKIKSFGSQGLSIGSIAGGTVKLGANNVTIASLTENGDGSTNGDLDGTGTVTVTGQAKFGGGIQSGSGTTLLKGSSTVSYILYLNGGRTVENEGSMVMNGDTDIYFSGGTFKNDAGATFKVGASAGMQAETGTNSFVNSGTFAVTAGSSVFLNFAFKNTGTLSVGNGGFGAAGTGNQFGGKITGSGSVSFGAPEGFGGSSTLTTVSGLTIAGGVKLSNAGTADQVGNLTILSGEITNATNAAWNIDGGVVLKAGLSKDRVHSFTNSGTLTKTAGKGTAVIDATVTDTGQIVISDGSLKFEGSGNSFSGSISGLGTFALSGGTSVIGSNSNLTTAGWSIEASAKVTLEETLGYAGKLIVSQGAQLNLGDNILNLSGTGSSIGGTVSGTGTLLISGGGMTFASGIKLNVASVALSAGATSVAANMLYGGRFELDAPATLSIQKDDVLTLRGKGTTLSGTVDGPGTLAIAANATATASSLTLTGGIVLKNTGTIDQTGTVAIGGKVSGAGTLAIEDNATLTLSGAVDKGQSVRFAAKKGTLALASPSTFRAGIKGFAAADTIDLTQFHFSSGTSVSFAENAGNTGGVLTIMDGALQAKLTLFGQYASTGFHIVSDHTSGSAITYSQPSAQDVALAPHAH